jgi:hypothetical protein
MEPCTGGAQKSGQPSLVSPKMAPICCMWLQLSGLRCHNSQAASSTFSSSLLVLVIFIIRYWYYLLLFVIINIHRRSSGVALGLLLCDIILSHWNAYEWRALVMPTR